MRRPCRASRAAALVRGAVRLASIFDKEQLVRVAQLEERIRVSGVAVEVDADRSPWFAGRSRRPPQLDVDLAVTSSQSTSTGAAPSRSDGQDSR